jgi:hypothetical protein
MDIGLKRVIILALICSCGQAFAQETWTSEQQAVMASMERLSATTAPGGGGADAYGAVLADDFSRWTTGSSLINDKKAWVTGVKDWFEDGWRVTDRQNRNLEIKISDKYAFTRRVVEETYLGPNGDSTVSKAALAEIWILENGVWLLLLANADVLDQ